MYWQIIIAISISFIVPIIWKILVDKEFFYFFYICHIVFGQIFFTRFYQSELQNILFTRSFLSFSFISYSIFLYFLFKSVYIKIKFFNKNINVLLICCLLLQVIISGILRRTTGNDELSNYAIELFNFIGIFLFAIIVYQLLVNFKELKFTVYIGIGIASLVIGTLIGHLFYYSNSSNSILNPYYISQYTFLLELMIFNGVIFFIAANKRFADKTIIFENEMQISSLQRSALQAQMNPHFIFNCLNSIQNFIMQNEKLEAMDYLNRFANLIRQNLDASTSNTILLSDELDMLKNYIELEQMRFNDAFDYAIHIGDKLDIGSTFIPPLLIQPFVENAILHGVAGIEQRGKIQIDISKEHQYLYIHIIDNGRGITDNQKDKMHKSHAMKITSQRLDYINSAKDKLYNINTTSSEKGTHITISVYLPRCS